MTNPLILMLCAGIVASMNHPIPDPAGADDLPPEEIDALIEADGSDIKYPTAAAAVEALKRRRDYERSRLCAVLENVDTPESVIAEMQKEIRELEDRIRQHQVQAQGLN